MRVFAIWLGFASALCVATGNTADLPDDPSTVLISGAGNNSCATWTQSHASQQEGIAWIMGYWSGANQEGFPHHVGHTTDSMGLIAEVRKVCDAAPSKTLYQAVFQVFKQLKDASR